MSYLRCKGHNLTSNYKYNQKYAIIVMYLVNAGEL